MTLDFLARGLVQMAVGYVVTSAAVSLAVILLWDRAATRAGTAASCARRLFWLRLAPTVAGAGVAALGVLPAYWWLEPRGLPERVGTTALVVAGVASLFLLATAWRAVRAVQSATTLARDLGGSASGRLAGLPVPALVIETSFPVVALVGVMRSRLLVSSRVLDVCSPPELDAIVRHELAHLDARDNLRHLCLRACADALAWLPPGRRLEQDWIAAAEEAADERAAGPDPGRRVELAGALVKVARLATDVKGEAGAPRHAIALYRGEPIAARVRSLLAPAAELPHRRPARAHRVVAVLVMLTLAAAPLLLTGLHAALEALIALGR